MVRHVVWRQAMTTGEEVRTSRPSLVSYLRAVAEVISEIVLSRCRTLGCL